MKYRSKDSMALPTVTSPLRAEMGRGHLTPHPALFPDPLIQNNCCNTARGKGPDGPWGLKDTQSVSSHALRGHPALPLLQQSLHPGSLLPLAFAWKTLEADVLK